MTVVVLGSGAAGLVAALAAREHGREVTVLERTDSLGGTTAVSGGGIWMPQNHHMSGDSREAALAYTAQMAPSRSEESRVGKECERLCRSRWSPYH